MPPACSAIVSARSAARWCVEQFRAHAPGRHRHRRRRGGFGHGGVAGAGGLDGGTGREASLPTAQGLRRVHRGQQPAAAGRAGRGAGLASGQRRRTATGDVDARRAGRDRRAARGQPRRPSRTPLGPRPGTRDAGHAARAGSAGGRCAGAATLVGAIRGRRRGRLVVRSTLARPRGIAAPGGATAYLRPRIVGGGPRAGMAPGCEVAAAPRGRPAGLQGQLQRHATGPGRHLGAGARGRLWRHGDGRRRHRHRGLLHPPRPPERVAQ